MKRCGVANGYTLIEMISVMGLMSMIMSIAVAWIVQTMRIDSLMRQRLANHEMLLRLDQQLREDVRLGQAMSVHDSGLTIEFAGNRSAVYLLKPDKLIYESRNGAATIRQESFRFLADAKANWDTSAMPQSIGLVVARTAELGDSSPVDLHVQAHIQPNRRYIPELESASD